MKSTQFLLINIIFFCMFITACSTEVSTYESKQAIANGDVVSVHGQITNLDKLEDFIDKVNNGEKDKVTVTTYTIEGDAIIHVLNYNGKNIQYDVDMRRDNYAAKEDRKIEKYKFTNIGKETNEGITYYYLYNNDKTIRMSVLEASTLPNN